MDNPKLSRPGIDLIGVKFGNSENEDIAYLVEIKGTEDSIYSQIYSIVNWFNIKLEKNSFIYTNNDFSLNSVYFHIL